MMLEIWIDVLPLHNGDKVGYYNMQYYNMYFIFYNRNAIMFLKWISAIKLICIA